MTRTNVPRPLDESDVVSLRDGGDHEAASASARAVS